MNNVHLQRRIDKVKSDVDDIIGDLIAEVESLEDTIDDLSDKINMLEEERVNND